MGPYRRIVPEVSGMRVEEVLAPALPEAFPKAW